VNNFTSYNCKTTKNHIKVSLKLTHRNLKVRPSKSVVNLLLIYLLLCRHFFCLFYQNPTWSDTMTSPLFCSVIVANSVNYDTGILLIILYRIYRLPTDAKLLARVSIWVVKAKLIRIMSFEIANIYG
jgi:hypothetical protein